MKNNYIITFLLFITLCIPTIAIAQCDEITLESLSNPGPFEVATLTEADGIRNGPDYNGATIYYPVNADGPFASMAIVPGFNSFPQSVEQWGPFYASHGIVTIIIGTNSIFDFPEARAEALLDALETIRQENTRDTSPLEAAIDDTKFAVSGWSMGGGGAQRAAVLDSDIKGIVALCPWLPNPELNHETPVLIFSGENDTVAPPSIHANVHYTNTPESTNKLLFELDNGNHSVANTPQGGNGVIGQIALSWFKLYVEENDCYCSLLTDELLVNPTEASNVQSSFECQLLGVTAQAVPLNIYPNPTDGLLSIDTQQIVPYYVFSPLGQLLQEGSLQGSQTQIDLSALPTGVYYLNIGNETIKVVKR